MEAELRSLAEVAAATGVALCYSFTVTRRLSASKHRLVSVFPVLLLFALAPLSFSTVHLKVTCAFIFTWLTSFKLLLLAFHRGPLSDPRLPLPSFLVLAALPVYTDGIAAAKPLKPGVEYSKRDGYTRELPVPPAVENAGKVAVLALVITLYADQHRYPVPVVLTMYAAYVYITLDLLLATAALAARPALLPGMSLDAQFLPPYLAKSLRDFWSRRWNLAASGALRAAVYSPVRSRLGPVAGVAGTFLVSGAVHEAVIFYVTGNRPTGEIATFFALQGLGLVTEAAVIDFLRRRGWRRPLPRVVAAPLALGYIFVTGFVFLVPPVARSGLEEVVTAECLAAVEAVRSALGGRQGFSTWTI